MCINSTLQTSERLWLGRDSCGRYGRTERPVHLPLHAVAVQNENEVLLLLHLNGNFTDTDGFTGKPLTLFALAFFNAVP